MRKPGLPVTRELPTAEIVDNGTEPLRVRLSSGQIVPITEFLNAAFGGRFKFGAPLGVSAMVAVRAGPLHCWHNACHAQTTIVTGVDVVFGPNLCTFSVKELGLHPDLFDVIHGRIPTNRQMGALKKRYSKTQDGSYLSNGCYRCDRIIGEFFEHDAYGEQVVVCEFPIRLSEPWRKAIDLHYGYDDSWAVYAPDGGSLPGLIERQPSIIP